MEKQILSGRWRLLPEIRAELGMNIETVAGQIGISYATVARIERSIRAGENKTPNTATRFIIEAWIDNLVREGKIILAD